VERYDHDCKHANNRLESAKADVEVVHEDEQEKHQAVDEWKRQLDIVGAEYGRVRANYVRSVHDHQSASRSIVYTEDEVENCQVQVDEAIEKKQAFLEARDEKNYYGGGVPRPDKDCFLATMDARVLCTELGVG